MSWKERENSPVLVETNERSRDRQADTRQKTMEAKGQGANGTPAGMGKEKQKILETIA